MALHIGELLNRRYRIQKRLGRGGFGTVYLAVDERLNRPVAVKERMGTFDGAVTQFHLEARFMAARPDIDEAGIEDDSALPHVYDHIVDPHGQYLIMEHIEGETIQRVLDRNGPLSVADALDIAHQAGSALKLLHSLGIVHRDVKPDNIIRCTAGRIKLIDYGIAKVYEQGVRTVNAARADSPGYSPPEQYAKKDETDARSDVYSLGATLYAMLLRKHPQEAEKRLVRDTLQPPHERDESIPRPVSNAVMKAMALDPADRFQSMAEFLAALDIPQPAAPDIHSRETILQYRPVPATTTPGEKTVHNSQVYSEPASRPPAKQARPAGSVQRIGEPSGRVAQPIEDVSLWRVVLVMLLSAVATVFTYAYVAATISESAALADLVPFVPYLYVAIGVTYLIGASLMPLSPLPAGLATLVALNGALVTPFLMAVSAFDQIGQGPVHPLAGVGMMLLLAVSFGPHMLVAWLMYGLFDDSLEVLRARNKSREAGKQDTGRKQRTGKQRRRVSFSKVWPWIEGVFYYLSIPAVVLLILLYITLAVTGYPMGG